MRSGRSSCARSSLPFVLASALPFPLQRGRGQLSESLKGLRPGFGFQRCAGHDLLPLEQGRQQHQPSSPRTTYATRRGFPFRSLEPLPGAMGCRQGGSPLVPLRLHFCLTSQAHCPHRSECHGQPASFHPTRLAHLPVIPSPQPSCDICEAQVRRPSQRISASSGARPVRRIQGCASPCSHCTSKVPVIRLPSPAHPSTFPFPCVPACGTQRLTQSTVSSPLARADPHGEQQKRMAPAVLDHSIPPGQQDKAKASSSRKGIKSWFWKLVEADSRFASITGRNHASSVRRVDTGGKKP
jgi:hypothetical protein